MTGLTVGRADDGLARHVLVVDDEEDVRDPVAMWLSDDPRCAAVSEVADPDSAVHAVRARHFDVVLLDFFLGARVCVEVLPQIVIGRTTQTTSTPSHDNSTAALDKPWDGDTRRNTRAALR